MIFKNNSKIKLNLIIIIFLVSLVSNISFSDYKEDYDFIGKEILKLENEGFTTFRISDNYEKVSKIINSSNYTKIESEINVTISLINNFKSLIQDKKYLDQKIVDLENENVFVEKGFVLLNDAEKELLIENYEGSQKILNDLKKEIVTAIKEDNLALIEGLKSINLYEIDNNFDKKNARDLLDKIDKDSKSLLIEDLERDFHSFYDINDSYNCLIKMSQEMEIIDEGINFFEDTYLNAVNYYFKEDFKRLLEFCESFFLVEKDYINSKDNILIIDEKILKSSFEDLNKIQDYESIILQIKNEFKNENYFSSYEKSEDLINELDKIESKNIIFKTNIGFFQRFVQKYKYVVLTFLILGILILIVSRKKIYTYLLIKKAISLKEKLRIMDNLLEKNQKKYFKNRNITKDEYLLLKNRDENKVVEIKEKLFLLKTKLKKL